MKKNEYYTTIIIIIIIIITIIVVVVIFVIGSFSIENISYFHQKSQVIICPKTNTFI